MMRSGQPVRAGTAGSGCLPRGNKRQGPLAGYSGPRRCFLARTLVASRALFLSDPRYSSPSSRYCIHFCVAVTLHARKKADAAAFSVCCPRGRAGYFCAGGWRKRASSTSHTRCAHSIHSERCLRALWGLGAGPLSAGLFILLAWGL